MKPEALSVSARRIPQVLESRASSVRNRAPVRCSAAAGRDLGERELRITASAIWFGDEHALCPGARAIEREFARVVFNDPDRFHLELDLSAR